MEKIASIQVLRALAALAVVYSHAGAEAHRLAEQAGGAMRVPLMTHGQAGVDLFFLISGFVMVFASKDIFAAPDAPRIFLLRRLCRIVPLYWLATSVYLVLMFAVPGLMNAPVPTFVEIVKSYLFIPYLRADGLAQPVYGLGWTLNYEMFFYALFAGAIFLPMRLAVPLLVTTLGALVVVGGATPGIAEPWRFWTNPMIAEFAAGMCLGWLAVDGHRFPKVLGLALGAGGCLAFLAANPVNLPDNNVERLATVGMPMALILAGIALTDWRLSSHGLLARLGDASYALYLVHPFALRMTRNIVDHVLPGAGGWPYIVIALAGSMVAAILVNARFERPVLAFLRLRLR